MDLTTLLIYAAIGFLALIINASIGLCIIDKDPPTKSMLRSLLMVHFWSIYKIARFLRWHR